jgi:hypothetical protein
MRPRAIIFSDEATSLRRWYERHVCSLSFAATFLALVAPKATAWLFPLIGALLFLVRPAGQSEPIVHSNQIPLPLVSLATFAWVSVAWSADATSSVAAAATFSLYLTCWRLTTRVLLASIPRLLTVCFGVRWLD